MQRELVQRAIGNLFADPTHQAAEAPTVNTAESPAKDRQKAAGSAATAKAA